MKIMQIVRTDEFVRIKHQVGTKIASETRDVTYHEAPLKAFDDALQALAPICGNWVGAGADYGSDVTVRSVTLSFTKSGTKSATIAFKKPLDINDAGLLMSTPCVQIDEPYANEDTRRECHKKQAEAIYKLLGHAEDYVNGDRQQMVLPLPKEKEEPEDGDALKFPPPEGKKHAHG